MNDSNTTDDGTEEGVTELLADLPDRLRDEADAAVAERATPTASPSDSLTSAKDTTRRTSPTGRRSP